MEIQPVSAAHTPQKFIHGNISDQKTLTQIWTQPVDSLGFHHQMALGASTIN